MKLKAIVIFVLCVLVGTIGFSIYQKKPKEEPMSEVAEISSDNLYSSLVQEMNEAPELREAYEQEKTLHDNGNTLATSQIVSDKEEFLAKVTEILKATYTQKAGYIQKWKEKAITEVGPEAEKVAELALREIKEFSLASELDLNLKVHFIPLDRLEGLAQAQANMEHEQAGLQSLVTSYQEKKAADPNDPSLLPLQEELLQAQVAFVNQAAFYMEQVQRLEHERITEWQQKALDRGENEADVQTITQACYERIASRRLH